MASVALERLRNLGIVAHIDAGKTTVSERILFYTGVEHRMGEVHEGTAVMDYLEEERRRGITITAAATSVPWRGHVINLIDTPGHVDFTIEVERSLRVLDGAVLVINGVAGVQAQSETVWRQLARHRVSTLAFVNQLDRAGADYFRCATDLARRLETRAVPVQYPVGEGRGLRTLIDLVEPCSWTFHEEALGRDPLRESVPPALADEVGVLRAELIEAVAEGDEEIMALSLEDRPVSAALLRSAVRRAVLARRIVPVLAGAALRNVGVQLLLDAVVDWLPAPSDLPPVQGVLPGTTRVVRREPRPDAPLSALAFKLVADPSEDLLFARIYSGTIESGARLFNPRVGRMERVARVLQMHADHRRAIERGGPGEIVALTGCKLSVTGDTLCDREAPIVLESLDFPAPVITRTVEPLASGDRERLRVALERLCFEDPSFHVREDAETGQWLVMGMGELHLEIKQHQLEEDFHLEVRMGQPRVAYRESVVASGNGSARVERVLAGKPIFAALRLRVEPGRDERGAPVAIDWAAGVTLAPLLRAAVTDALRHAAEVGPRFGYPLTSAQIAVLGVESHPERDSESGFAQAAALALRDALQGAEVVLLEPESTFEIETPAEFASGIIAELNAKRAEISDVVAEGGLRRVRGRVPLAQMFGFATTLRSLSQGRAGFALTPTGFRRVPEAELAARGLIWS
jgi:elongation factor G